MQNCSSLKLPRYIKDCIGGEDCKWDEKEFSRQDSAVQKVINKSAIKTLTIKAVCSYEENVSHAPDEILSDICIFNVALRGRNDSDDEIHYQLTIEDSYSSHQLNLNHFLETQ